MVTSRLELVPLDNADTFDLIQERGNERRLFAGCRVTGFELRVVRGEAVKLKLDVAGDLPAAVYPYADTVRREYEERFHGDNVRYRINGNEYNNIYGITFLVKKEKGVQAELWVKRLLKHGADIPEIIDEMIISAQLQRDKYEERHYGLFRITITKLVMVSDEIEVDTAGAVIGPVRFYVAGVVTAEIFSTISIHADC
jgi:hypothetical protein